MIIKYRTGGFGNNLIERVEVEKETAKMVVINGRRTKKDSGWHTYPSSWEDAKQHLLDRAELELKSARRRLEAAQGKLGNIKGLKKPD